jgi:hypothetical protein
MVAKAIGQRECEALGLCAGEGRSRVGIDESAGRCRVSADESRVVWGREKQAAKDRRGKDRNGRDGRGVDDSGHGALHDGRVEHGWK